MIVWQGKDTLTYRVQRAEQQERQAEQQGRQAEQQVLRAEQQVQVVRAEELAGLALEVAYFVHNIVVAGKKVAGKEMVADLVVRKVAAHRAVERRVAAHKAVEHRVAAHKAVERRVADHKAVERRVAAHKAVERRVAAHKAVEHRVADHKAVERRVAAHKAVERRVADHKAVVRRVAAHTDHIVVACLVVHHMVAFHTAVDQTFRPLAVVRIVHPFQRCHQVSSQGRMVKQQTLCN